MSIPAKKMLKKSKQASEQSNLNEEQPVPIQFHYKQIRDKKNTAKNEREVLAEQEKHKELTKKERTKLAAEELVQKNRENQIAQNKQRERYGARGPRQNR